MITGHVLICTGHLVLSLLLPSGASSGQLQRSGLGLALLGPGCGCCSPAQPSRSAGGEGVLVGGPQGPGRGWGRG